MFYFSPKTIVKNTLWGFGILVLQQFIFSYGWRTCQWPTTTTTRCASFGSHHMCTQILQDASKLNVYHPFICSSFILWWTLAMGRGIEFTYKEILKYVSLLGSVFPSYNYIDFLLQLVWFNRVLSVVLPCFIFEKHNVLHGWKL